MIHIEARAIPAKGMEEQSLLSNNQFQESMINLKNNSARPSVKDHGLEKKSSVNDQVVEFGLTNLDGQFNCYFNVIIQALWHSDTFRPALLRFKDMAFHPKVKEHGFISEL